MKPEEQPCEFPACAVHHICENPCKRNRTETLAKALHDMADVDFDNVFLRSAAHLRALDASHQRLKEALQRARNGLSGGLWDYGPGQDEHTECNALIEELDAALEQAKDLS